MALVSVKCPYCNSTIVVELIEHYNGVTKETTHTVKLAADVR